MKSMYSGRAEGLSLNERDANTRKAGVRSDQYLAMQQENHDLGQERATREREAAAAGDECLPGFIYGAVSGQDPATVIGSFNQYGKMRISDYTLNQDHSISLVGEDGQQASIPSATVHAFMKKHKGLDLAGSTSTLKSSTFDKGRGLEGLSRYYDLSNASAAQKAAAADGVMKGLDFAEIGKSLGLSPHESPESMRIAEIDAEIESQMEKQAKGDHRHWGRPRSEIVAKLKAEKIELEKSLTRPDGVKFGPQGIVVPEAPTPAPAPEPTINSQGETVTGLGDRMPVMPTSRDQLDKDKNGRLDEEYAFSLRVVELMKNPLAKKALEKRYGATKLTEFEEIAKAVRKHMGQKAKERVASLSPSPVGNR